MGRLRRKLQADLKQTGPHATEDQKSRLILRCNALRREIDSWIAIQSLYLPGTLSMRSAGSLIETGGMDAPHSAERPESIPLLLPSDICHIVSCDQKFLEIKWALRYVQACDALNECRHHIRLRVQLLKFKDRNLRGQGANTRAQRTLQTVQDRLTLSHLKYNRAHAALSALAPQLDKVGWQDKLQPLKATDLRAMGDLLDGQTQGTAIMSWIWLTQGLPNEDVGLQDSKHESIVSVV